jgi:hypothetical protein
MTRAAAGVPRDRGGRAPAQRQRAEEHDRPGISTRQRCAEEDELELGHENMMILSCWFFDSLPEITVSVYFIK